MSKGKNRIRVNGRDWIMPKGSQEIVKNNWVWQDYYYRLKESALNIFEWTGLPDTVDPRFIELTLFEQGLAVFFEDPIMGYLCLQCAISGRLNVYRIPIDRRAYAMNGYNRILDIDNSVIVWNNYLHQPTEMTIRLYADRLYNLQRCFDVNVKGLKHPVIVKGKENIRLSLKNAVEQYEDNEPYIFVGEDMPMDSLTTIDTTVPMNIDKILIAKNMVWNEAMTFIGIENANQDKKERLVSNEVGANYEQVEQSRWNMLNARKQACEQINRMFGLNIDVQFRKTGSATKSDRELIQMQQQMTGKQGNNVSRETSSFDGLKWGATYE